MRGAMLYAPAMIGRESSWVASRASVALGVALMSASCSGRPSDGTPGETTRATPTRSVTPPAPTATPTPTPTPTPEPVPDLDPAEGPADDAAREAAARQAAIAEASRQAREGLPEPSARYNEIVNVTATVTEARGLSGIGPGTTCSFEIAYGATRNALHCRAAIDCASHALYGTREELGFFACTAFSTAPALVIGVDRASTRSDGDARFAIDSTAGTFSLSDDAHGPNGAFMMRGTVRVTGEASHGAGTGYGS